jgi:hypothetical protein
MTTATTTPVLAKERDVDLDALHPPVFYNVTGLETWNADSELANDSRPDTAQSDQMAICHFVVRVPAVATDYAIKIFQYGGDTDALILVDFDEPEDEFPKDHLETVRFLRGNGRRILADKLVTLLHEAQEDPDEVRIKIASLRDMAQLLVEQGRFADPSIGPDGWGVIHAQWRITGNGLLVMSFLGYGEVLLTARANKSPSQDRLRISQRMRAQDILREYGHLVPLRN